VKQGQCLAATVVDGAAAVEQGQYLAAAAVVAVALIAAAAANIMVLQTHGITL